MLLSPFLLSCIALLPPLPIIKTLSDFPMFPFISFAYLYLEVLTLSSHTLIYRLSSYVTSALGTQAHSNKVLDVANILELAEDFMHGWKWSPQTTAQVNKHILYKEAM